jgi:purine-binding chemotaxis protein CheW
MAVKKKTGKTAAKTTGQEAAPAEKITLPPFGLADEILGMYVADAAITQDKSPQSPPERNIAPESVSYDAHAKSDDRAVGDLHLVTFHLESEEFGVDIGRVQEIIRVGQVTAVPNAPGFIRGVINLRGRIIPVLDLRKRLALPEAPLTKHSRIVVVEAGAKVLGLLVDRVSQVLRLNQESIDAPPDEIAGSRAFVRGIGKVDSRLIMIMELDRVLARDASQAAQHALLAEA